MEVFDVEGFIEDCRLAGEDLDPHGAVREVAARALARPQDLAEVFGRPQGGLEVLFASPRLTVLNAVWPPGITLPAHDHRMWATLAIYAGSEENHFFRRGDRGLEASGVKLVETGEVLNLGVEAVHSVHNRLQRMTGAIHVYGGDFTNAERSQWDPETGVEEPFDIERAQGIFALANEAWRSGGEAGSHAAGGAGSG